MSDGPHRSLPMRRHWKDFAERAAKAAYSGNEVCEALMHALWKDLAEAPLAEVRAILQGRPQGDLFADERFEQLETVRRSTRPSAASKAIIDCAIEAVSDGLTGEAAFVAALENACEECVRSSLRSIEEHYYRKATVLSALYVRDRLYTLLQQCDFRQTATEFLFSGKSPCDTSRLPRRSGLDEGPAL